LDSSLGLETFQSQLANSLIVLILVSKKLVLITILLVSDKRIYSIQDVLYDYRADLHGIRNRTIVM